MSLSAHLVEDYQKTRPQKLVQSGAMEYDALSHGRQQMSAFSQFSQAGLDQAYRGDTSVADFSMSNASFNARALAPMDRSSAPLTPQEMFALQQQYEEAQALRTAERIAALQAKLNQKLGPEYISQRPGPGGGMKLTYAEGWKIINLANEVFGFNGWSSQVVKLETDFIDYIQETQRYNVGVTAIVRVSLRDGVWHEDIGYGMLENSKSKGMAIDKCKKEAVTDGLKRTLRNFGNVLGNCLYDKEYTKEILRMKTPAPPKFDTKELHRRREFAEAGAGPSNAGPSTSGSGQQSAQRPMAPPPAPAPRQPNISRPNVASTSNTTPVKPPNPTNPAVPVKVESPGSTSTAPNPVVRSLTDESLYAMGSDDDALFAELSFDEVEASALDPGVSFADRSTRVPSAGSSFEAAPLKVAPSDAASKQASTSKSVPASTTSRTTSSKIAQSVEEAALDRKRKIMAALINSDPPTPAGPVPGPSAKPRTSSGGGFAIPPGVVRPQRPSQSSDDAKNITTANTSGIGSKRSSDASNQGEAGLHGFGTGSGGIQTARTALTELDNTNVKRPRLS